MSRAAMGLWAAGVLGAFFLLLVGGVAGLRVLDHYRALRAFELNAACRACMGPGWSSADFDRCCPEYPGPVSFGCGRHFRLLCEALPADLSKCEEAVSMACYRVVPLDGAWTHPPRSTVAPSCTPWCGP
jgi:hypothetical protein